MDLAVGARFSVCQTEWGCATALAWPSRILARVDLLRAGRTSVRIGHSNVQSVLASAVGESAVNKGSRGVALSARRVGRAAFAWGPRVSWLRVAWVRYVCVALMTLVTPGPTDLAMELVEWVTGVECCGGACEDTVGQCCPRTCTHCRCCAHPVALVPRWIDVPEAHSSAQPEYALGSASRSSPGYRAPPFRPPQDDTLNA